MTYFVTSLTMPDPQSSDMHHMGKWCQLSLWHQLFNHDFILYIVFIRIAASNTTTDDITK